MAIDPVVRGTVFERASIWGPDGHLLMAGMSLAHWGTAAMGISATSTLMDVSPP